jgi:hypothetical protein
MEPFWYHAQTLADLKDEVERAIRDAAEDGLSPEQVTLFNSEAYSERIAFVLNSDEGIITF